MTSNAIEMQEKGDRTVEQILAVADKTLGGDVDPTTADILEAEEEYTEEQYKKLLRKIDWTILPLMWIRCVG